jgi:hypothetical protein
MKPKSNYVSGHFSLKDSCTNEKQVSAYEEGAASRVRLKHTILTEFSVGADRVV